MVYHFLQQKHPLKPVPSLCIQYNKQQPEGSPQARRATGWLFVTKCSRLNADITVISSPTKREAKNRGKSCAFPRPGPVIWAAAPAGCPSAERRVPGWPLLRAPRPPEPGRHPLPASRGPPRQTPPPSEAGAGREEPAGSGSPRGRDKVSGKRPDASRRRRGGGRASADLLPLRPSAPTTGATLLRP